MAVKFYEGTFGQIRSTLYFVTQMGKILVDYVLVPPGRRSPAQPAATATELDINLEDALEATSIVSLTDGLWQNS